MSKRIVPNEIKKLQGSFNVTRELKHPPEFDKINSLPEAPKTLGEYGREMWVKHGQVLMNNGLLNVANLWALEGFCGALESANKAWEKKDNSPADFRHWKQVMELVAVYGSKFGLDPASATKVSRNPGAERANKSPFMQALSGEMKVAK